MDLLACPDEVLAVIAAQLPPDLRHSSFSLVHTRCLAAAEHATKQQAGFSHTFNMRIRKPMSNMVTYKGVTDYEYYDEAHEEADEQERYYSDIPHDYTRNRQLSCKRLVEQWLPSHGQHLTKLQLVNFNRSLQHLPPKLKELELYGCVDVRRWDYGARATQVYSCLTKLYMSTCSYPTSATEELAAATSLQHLTLNCCPKQASCCDHGTDACTHCNVDSSLLKNLTNLTQLEMRTRNNAYRVDGVFPWQLLPLTFPRRSDPMRHLSCLVKLQTLNLSTTYATRELAAGLNGATALTSLNHLWLSVEKGWGPTPWLSLLTSLQSLCLEHFSIKANQLHGLSQLARLHLIEVDFDPAQLLTWLSHLTQLQHQIVQKECGGCCDPREELLRGIP